MEIGHNYVGQTGLETNSDYDFDDKEFLQIEWKKHYLVDKDLHLNAQKRFLGLLCNEVQDHQDSRDQLSFGT